MEWAHVSSYVELQHRVTDMGTNIPMSLSEVKLLQFCLHLLYTDKFVLGIIYVKTSKIDRLGLSG